MSYAIIGFGKIGHALAKAFARNDIEVSVATTRDPESFASGAAAIGPTIIPKTLVEAVKADIVFLAVRFEAHPDVLPGSSRRLSLGEDWSRASTTWALPSLNKIRPCMVAGASCSSRATMTARQRRLERLWKSSDSRRSNLAGFRKVDYLCRRAEIPGVG